MKTTYIYLTNNSGGNASLQLFHKNSSHGLQSAGWFASPGATVGPLAVDFESELGPGYWYAYLVVFDGPNPGEFVSGGSYPDPHWTECRLFDSDNGKHETFSIDTNEFYIKVASGGTKTGMMQVPTSNIPATGVTNVFVLMLENHSFDNMLAMSGIPGIVAATTKNTNLYNDTTYPVISGAPDSMPTDPGHEFPDVVEQLAGVGATYPSGGPYPTITNSGFAANYATSTTEGPAPQANVIGDIMACFTTDQIPVLTGLAKLGTVCDQWFSSMPGPTWPNRFFVHGASSAGLDTSPTTSQILAWETGTFLGYGFTYPNGSVYDWLTKNNCSWRLYIDDSGAISGSVPQVSAIHNITAPDVNSLSDFASDLQAPYFYRYTFIEPNYGDLTDNSYEGGSSQHPMDSVAGGENLIANVYNTIRNSPVWPTSILIITYDEHGGFYDSVNPGPAQPPNDNPPKNGLNTYGFDFAQYGVRVPAVIVSPLITQGTVDDNTYDHTSIIATLRELFSVPGYLTMRDYSANSLGHLVTIPPPTAETPWPTNIASTAAPKSPRKPLTTEERTLIEQQPLPTEGNLVGFLGIALKTELELSNGTAEQRRTALENFKKIKTRGHAKAYIEAIMKRVKVERALRKTKGMKPRPADHK